jgi:hypothetical protein
VRRGEVSEQDAVCLLVTGDGLKTPQPVAERVQPIVDEADGTRSTSGSASWCERSLPSRNYYYFTN